MYPNKYMKKLYLIALFSIAFLERVVFDLGPNAELITTAMILSAIYVGKKESFWLIFAIVAITDRLIGNTNIILFTWTGFLIPAYLLGKLLKDNKNKIIKTMFGTGAGIGANFFFFLWTNFGVWYLDSWGIYPDTLQGLIASYVNALPFLKAQLTSTLVFIPLGILLTETALKYKGSLLKQLTKLTLTQNSQ
jgi:hypothetical protein